LRSHDSRRWQNHPHLSVSLAYLRDIILYLQSQRIHMYRLSADLAPYLSHPAFPQFHDQIDECAADLVAAGDLARRLDLRLSFHAGAHVLLNAPDPMRQARAQAELNGLAALLDGMRLGPEAVIVIHIGGGYQNHGQALDDFARGFETLSPSARARVVLEHDDRQFDVSDCLSIHRRTGIPLVFDLLHHQVLNPTHLLASEALAACLSTWPAQQTPKIHLATPATEMVRDSRGQPHPPRLNRHSHYLNPFPVIDFLRSLPPVRSFDAMLEAKARDLALLQFRQHLASLAPDVVERFGVL
jgi:UV DNA damage endonuclease